MVSENVTDKLDKWAEGPRMRFSSRLASVVAGVCSLIAAPLLVYATVWVFNSAWQITTTLTVLTAQVGGLNTRLDSALQMYSGMTVDIATLKAKSSEHDRQFTEVYGRLDRLEVSSHGDWQPRRQTHP